LPLTALTKAAASLPEHALAEYPRLAENVQRRIEQAQSVTRDDRNHDTPSLGDRQPRLLAACLDILGNLLDLAPHAEQAPVRDLADLVLRYSRRRTSSSVTLKVAAALFEPGVEVLQISPRRT
jgi:hypothetical protein